MSRRGPKLRDTIALVERIVEILDENPGISGNAVVVLAGARRQDVLRVIRMLRSRESRFRISQGADP